MVRWFTVLLVAVIAVLLGVYLLSSDTFDPESVRNKNVIITGASKNIGKNLAIEYAKLGANVVITARNENKLKEVLAMCKEAGAASANYIVADMNDLNQTKMVIERATSLLGGIDYLVLNHAALASSPRLWSGSVSELDYMTKSSFVNYMSFVHLSVHAKPYLSESNGHLVVVSSLAGFIPLPYNAAYGASKAAGTHFFSSQRMEMDLQKKWPYSISICLLGRIATEKSEEWNQVVTTGSHPVTDTAKEIIAGAVNRRGYVFVPAWSRVTTILRLVCSDWLERLVLMLLPFKYN